MRDILSRVADRLLGRGEAALTVPPLDGALKPNSLLEEARGGRPAEAPVALARHRGRVLWAEGHDLVAEDGARRHLPAPITAIAGEAGDHADTRLALALAGSGIEIDGVIPKALDGLDCITALAFEGGALWIARGSTRHPLKAWLHDFMEQNRTGQLLRYDIAAGRLSLVADRLGFPMGILPGPEGVLVSEAWAKRLIRVSPSGGLGVIAADMPGYPAGLAASGEGFWLAVFALRSPLLELVLREPAYRRAMMDEVAPEFWISPALRSGRSFQEPMQGGALKQMGVLKPWAPSRSYGLVVRMAANGTPLESLHSRAGGRRHGVTSVLEHQGRLWCAVTGGDEIVTFPLGRGA